MISLIRFLTSLAKADIFTFSMARLSPCMILPRVAARPTASDSASVVSIGEDRTVRVWNVADAKEAKKMGPTADDPYGLAFSKDGKVVLITGSPGSRTIINTVLQVVVNVIDFDMDIRAAVDAPRLHHQWFPDEARFEGKNDYPALVKKLCEMGHCVVGTTQGDAHSIRVDPKTGTYHGAEDRRIDGKVAGF